MSGASLIYAPVAQPVEQRTENPCVGGSSPPWGTTRCIQYILPYTVTMLAWLNWQSS